MTKLLSTSVRDVQVSNIKRPYEYETVVRDKESAKINIKVAKQGKTFKLSLSIAQIVWLWEGQHVNKLVTDIIFA